MKDKKERLIAIGARKATRDKLSKISGSTGIKMFKILENLINTEYDAVFQKEEDKNNE